MLLTVRKVMLETERYYLLDKSCIVCETSEQQYGVCLLRVEGLESRGAEKASSWRFRWKYQSTTKEVIEKEEMGLKHAQFFSRTVFVQNNDIEKACRALNRILGQEGLLDQYRRCRYYEKPTQVRRRINYERCKAIYDEDMNRKIQFVLRKNRVEPFPGCN